MGNSLEASFCYNFREMKFVLIIPVSLALSLAIFAQNPTPSPAKKTHVERFTTPESRAARNEINLTEKLKANQNDANLYNDRALARIRLQKMPEAYEDLRKAVELEPKNAEFYANLGYVLWKIGRYAEAIAAEREALKLDDKNYTANYQLGRFLIRTGDKSLLKEASERLRKALEIDPRQYEVRFELIAAYRELGDTAAAIRQLELLQDARTSDARVAYVSALLAIDKGDSKTALERFQDALKKDENLVGARQDLGLLYAKLERWSDAVEAFSELEKRQPDSPEAKYFKALALYNSGKTAEAENAVRQVLRLDAGSADALTLLGIILAANDKGAGEAIETLTQAVALAPENFDAWFYLGRLQYAAQNYAEAEKSLTNAVTKNPKSIEARFFLGSVQEVSGNSDAALKQYEEIVKLDEKSFYGQIGVGAIFVKQGKLDEAIGALNQAANSRKDNFEALWALGRAYVLSEKFAEAEPVLRRAVTLEKTRTDARYQLGITLRRLGKTAEAAQEFALVEKLNREFREGKTQ